MNLSNSKVHFDYFLLEKLQVGIALEGYEIKSIKSSNVSIKEAYCYIKNGELFIKNMHVTPWQTANNYDKIDPIRERKLLAKKNEIKKWEMKLKTEQHLTILVENIYTNKKGHCKLGIAIGQGKKAHDKRESIKRKDIEKQLKQINP